MQITGPRNSASAEQLRQALADTLGTFTWGIRKHNALEQLILLQDAGVPCVEFTPHLTKALEWEREGHMVFGRKLKHTHGRDIVASTSPELPTSPRFIQRAFWTKVVPNIAQEWRVHIFNGKSIARGLKVQNHEPTWNTPLPIRNRLTGWHMVHDVVPPTQVREVAKQAVKVLGYLYGAVDILWLEEPQIFRTSRIPVRALVLEVNQAPAMDEYTLERYVRAIKNL